MDLDSMVSRIYMPHPNAAPVENRPGLVLAGLRPKNGFPALVLIWDEAGDNPGCSATNSIETVMLWLSANWQGFPVREAVLVERDSDGAFDHAYPEWSSEPRVAPLIRWRPLRWGGAIPRTAEAFIGVFGDNAKRALELVASQVGVEKAWRAA